MARRVRKRAAKKPASRPQGPRRSRLQLPPLPAPSARHPSHNLPAQVTSFIGRDREIAEITQALSRTRLLTLTGSGGCGKTRLALQVAAALVGSYAEGVWVVELAPLSDSTLVAKAVASALGLSELPGVPVSDTLSRYLQTKSLLLLLDNCEHLLSACAELVEVLLRRCPDIRVLATSRAGLGIAGELTYRVPSLSAPESGPPDSLERLKEYEAVRLFVERAVYHDPRFQVTQGNAAAVAQVCSRLDGMPLAIELAAARVNVLTAEQIAARLDDRFRLLTGGSRTDVPRQQTLRATMDWSYDLLTAQERAVFRRVSVFAGGWTLEAAEPICSGNSVATSDILDLLAQLVDKSLVMVETQGGEARYHLLETVRQYGWDRLQESGEAADVRRRHRDWFLALAEQAFERLRGPEQQVWLERLTAEHDNLRAALGWSQADLDNPEKGPRLATALFYFWFLHGHWSEGRRWLDTADAGEGKAPSHVPANTLGYAAMLAAMQGDYERAAVLGQQGLASAEKSDVESLLHCRTVLGMIALHRGESSRAAMLFEENLDLCRKMNVEWQLGHTLSYLGFVARDQGDFARSAALHSEALALFRKVEDKHFTAWALRNLGVVALREGDHKQATAFCRESLRLQREIGDIWLAEQGLMGLGGAAALKGHYERAARLLAAAEALRKTLGRQRGAPDQADFDKRVASTRAGLGDAAFAAAWAQGTTMPLEEAIEAALAPIESPSAGATESLFTPRQREVVALVAQGLTNREIASRLVISERTADTHVQNILNKLGVDSRVQVAAWAIEHGLPHPPTA